MEEVFKTSVIEALQYYVYCLVDPRTNRIFYIGKGSGNRIFNHANDALNDNLSSLKLNIIREIRSKGVVRSVIEVRSWKWTLIAEDGTKFKRERCIFEGNLLEDSPYLNKDVSDYPFSRFGGSIRYIESL